MTRLEIHWRKKLRASGFDDIEHKGILREGRLGAATTALELAADTEYLHRGYFATRAARELWALHCEGMSIREIAAHAGQGRHSVASSLTETRKAMRSKIGKVGNSTPSVIRRTVAAMDIEDVFATLARVIG